jgi:hypothetical protein
MTIKKNFCRIINMKHFLFFLLIVFSICLDAAIIIDHTCRNINDVPLNWIDSAKAKPRIAYEFTSHGEQLIRGMDSLDAFMGGEWNIYF